MFLLRLSKIECQDLKNVEGLGRGKNDVFVRLTMSWNSMMIRTPTLFNSGAVGSWENIGIAIELDKLALSLENKILVEVFDDVGGGGFQLTKTLIGSADISLTDFQTPSDDLDLDPSRHFIHYVTLKSTRGSSKPAGSMALTLSWGALRLKQPKRKIIFRTLNYGAPGDIAVNVFEYLTQANTRTSIAFQDLLKTSLNGDKTAIAEAYAGADILDRRFKVGSRQSPLFQTQGMEFLWESSFSIDSYIATGLSRILDAFQADAELRKSQIKNAKIDIVVAKEKAAAAEGFDEERRTQQLLEEAVLKLVFFDAHCAKAIRDTVSWEQFCGLHAAASAVISRTNESILEELQQSQDSVYFLQELNPTVIESIRALVRPHGFSIKSTSDGSSAIIYPTAFDSEIRVIEFPVDDTFLHVETLVLGYRKLLLISSHFSAKTKAKAQEEGKTIHKNMDDQLVALNSFIAAKTAEGLICLVGGDFNQNTQATSVTLSALPSSFAPAGAAALEAAPAVAAEFVFPAAGTPTTCKERSALQVQFKKINKPDSGSKDRICIASPSPTASSSGGGASCHAEAVEVLDCRVRSLYTHGKAACSYALKPEAAAGDTRLQYPVRLQYPIYGTHFPDHDVVEVVADLPAEFFA